MALKKTTQKAKRDKRQGKSASTQAGEFVREEIDTVRAGKHGARSAKQAIAIGLSKARRAGVKLAAPKAGKASKETRKKAEKDLEAGKKPSKRPSPKRSKAAVAALKKEPKSSVSKAALSKQARGAAKKRTSAERSASAKKAAKTRAKKK